MKDLYDDRKRLKNQKQELRMGKAGQKLSKISWRHLGMTPYQDKTICADREHPLSGEQQGAVKNVGAQHVNVSHQKILFQPRLIFECFIVEIDSENNK